MWEIIKKNPKFIAGSIVVGIIIVMGLIGPMVTRDPLQKRWIVVPKGDWGYITTIKYSVIVDEPPSDWPYMTEGLINVTTVGDQPPYRYRYTYNVTGNPMPPGAYMAIEEKWVLRQFENGTTINEKKVEVYNGTFISGTAQGGKDVFAQLCMGIRNSLFVGAIGGALGTLIAVLLGALGAYRGGLADETSNIITNIIMVFPTFPALLVLASILDPRYFKLNILGMRIDGRSFITVGAIIALTSWPWAARCIRSQVLSLKEREFISLAKMSGMRSREIVIKDVLPNMLAYVIMVFVLLTGGAMLAEAWLSVLGLGPSYTENVTLGNMIYACRQASTGNWESFWWWWVTPGALLATLLSAVFIMHAGMDEIFNPRLRRV
jgi:peptide/nickel transport system permease protein